jgi:hypothetical protein
VAIPLLVLIAAVLVATIVPCTKTAIAVRQTAQMPPEAARLGAIGRQALTAIVSELDSQRVRRNEEARVGPGRRRRAASRRPARACPMDPRRGIR